MTWPQDAYVGQKVVCISQPEYKPHAGSPIPLLTETYTIKKISLSPFKKIVHFELDEIVNDFYYSTMNWTYSMFRPVQENKKGMEMLTALLNPINHKVLEDV